MSSDDTTYDVEAAPFGHVEPGFGGGRRLRLRGELHAGVVEWLRARPRITGLSLVAWNPRDPASWQPTPAGIRPLEGLQLTELGVTSRTDVASLGTVGGITSLRCLSLACPFGSDPVDLAALRDLDTVSLDLTRSRDPRLTGLDALRRVTECMVHGVDSELVAAMADWSDVRLLECVQVAPGTDFAPLARLVGLAHLRVAVARRVAGWAFLSSLTGLEVLCLESVAGPGDITFVERMPKLEWLKLENCGKIASIAPIRAAKRLDVLLIDGSTIVQDGDLSPAESPWLGWVSIRGRGAYSPPAPAVNRQVRPPRYRTSKQVKSQVVEMELRNMPPQA